MPEKKKKPLLISRKSKNGNCEKILASLAASKYWKEPFSCCSSSTKRPTRTDSNCRSKTSTLASPSRPIAASFPPPWQWQLKGGRLFLSRDHAFPTKKIRVFFFGKGPSLALFCCSGGKAGGYGVIKFGRFFSFFLSLYSSALTTRGEKIFSATHGLLLAVTKKETQKYKKIEPYKRLTLISPFLPFFDRKKILRDKKRGDKTYLRKGGDGKYPSVCGRTKNGRAAVFEVNPPLPPPQKKLFLCRRDSGEKEGDLPPIPGWTDGRTLFLFFFLCLLREKCTSATFSFFLFCKSSLRLGNGERHFVRRRRFCCRN